MTCAEKSSKIPTWLPLVWISGASVVQSGFRNEGGNTSTFTIENVSEEQKSSPRNTSLIHVLSNTLPSRYQLHPKISHKDFAQIPHPTTRQSQSGTPSPRGSSVTMPMVWTNDFCHENPIISGFYMHQWHCTDILVHKIEIHFQKSSRSIITRVYSILSYVAPPDQSDLTLFHFHPPPTRPS